MGHGAENHIGRCDAGIACQQRDAEVDDADVIVRLDKAAFTEVVDLTNSGL